MSTIKNKLGFNREHLISLALLLGCDYGLGGVKGIGKEQAMRLINGWKGLDPIKRFFLHPSGIRYELKKLYSHIPFTLSESVLTLQFYGLLVHPATMILHE